MSEGARAGPVMGAPPVSHHGIRAWALRRLRADLGNWRLLLVRTLTSAVAVVLTVSLLPGLSFHDWRHGDFLLVGVVFGLLVALVLPEDRHPTVLDGPHVHLRRRPDLSAALGAFCAERHHCVSVR